MKLYKQIINTLDKEFLHDEKYLRKPFFYYLIRLIAFGIFTALLFTGTEFISKIYPNHRANISMLNALVLPAWFYIAYLYFKHYDEMLKQILLKAMAPTAIVGITLLLASSFRVSIGGAESIDDAIIIVAMGITWLSSMIYWYIK